jgi:hypothetical protein
MEALDTQTDGKAVLLIIDTAQGVPNVNNAGYALPS